MALSNDIDFHKLFNPASLAFIGASQVPGKWGFIILANILRGKFQGKIYPVNPGQATILGMKCYPSISDIDDKIDIAVITVPAHKVPPVIDECIKKRVSNVVVITSDFSETGEEGALLEKEISAKAKSAGMGLVGPNTMGIFNAYGNLNILMPPMKIEPGYVSIVSQSGNVGIQIMSECLKRGIGISKLVSSGNEAIIKCEDYLTYLLEDDMTKIIVLYIESLKEGQRFMKICRENKAAKPIIVYKSGKTKGGKLAAASHTGAMAGSIEIYRSVFKQSGVVEAESTVEMIDLIGGFLSFPVPKGNRVGIVTIGGGWGVITADECETEGFDLPELSGDVYEKLNGLLPKYWSRRNPVDMVALLSMETYPKAIEAMALWDGIDSVISLGGPSPADFFKYDDLIKRLGFKKEDVDAFSARIDEMVIEKKKSEIELMKKYSKPILHVEMSADDNAYENMKNYNYTTFRSPERAVRVLKKMFDFNKMRERMNRK